MAVSRKTVTVLFADVADSTALGERIDPETLRGALARWFDEARAVIERHGGTVEKYIGDSVMAVFGVPRLHEDDALRAVRAAEELRHTLARLNAELERERGLHFTVRIGINTGEVVTGDGGGTLVTGDAVNVAKRLEEAGDGGDVIVGEPTHALAHMGAEFEPLAPLALKGKSSRVRAWRLVAIGRNGTPSERRFDTPLVGRRHELDDLRRAFRRSVEERTCQLFTLLGSAGIGKTRLACELVDELEGEATVLTGRCLPYGDGITFWPLVQVVGALGTEEDVRDVLAGAEDADLVADRVLEAFGRAPAFTAGGELFWAVRRLFEELAQKQPLLILLEDIHWAEPTLLDLLEYLAGWIHAAPVLLLCLARPELLDERPGWATSHTSLALAPLTDSETQALLDEIAHEWPLDARERARIAESSEGNPLYAEQMAAMLAEGQPLDSIPPTIHALLAARLDRLPPDERAVLERAAVAGKEFARRAVVELSPTVERADVDARLLSLVRKDLLAARPGREDAYRFRHVLIRDAAYAGIPKELRAQLHEVFADWAARTNAGRAGDLDEIVGYHYEQAFRSREQLGPVDDDARKLAKHAAVILGGAGRRAIRRGDMPAAGRLLERATSLLPPDDALGRELLLELGAALRQAGRFLDADETLREAAHRADEAADRPLRCHIALELALLHNYTYPERGTDELLRVADSVIPAFEELGDDAGLARAWLLIGEAHWYRCRIGPMEEALQRGLRHIQPGSGRVQLMIWNAMARAALAGPLPVADAIGRCREIENDAPKDRWLQAVLATVIAYLEAMRGRFETARELYTTSHATLAELGQMASRAALQTWSGAIELLAGDAAAAEAEFRSAFQTLEPMGDKQNLATIAASLAAALHAQQRDGEAANFTNVSERLASHDDATSQIEWRAVRAQVLAREGRVEEAEQLAHESLALAQRTDCPNLQGNAYLSLGETVAQAQREEAAATAFAAARDAYERKGNAVLAMHAAERLAAVRPTPTGLSSRD